MIRKAEGAEALAEAPRAAVGNSGATLLQLAASEGLLDLLLEQARAQRVDLARISRVDCHGSLAAGAALAPAAAGLPEGGAPFGRSLPRAEVGDAAPLQCQAALASTRLARLELTREAAVSIEQATASSLIRVRPPSPPTMALAG